MIKLLQFALLVDDYDQALAYYVDILGFTCLEDTQLEADKRWVVIAPENDAETRILLAKAADEHQATRVGDQTGGRVFLFLQTDDFDGTFAQFQQKGVKFLEAPRVEPYGKVVVFEDLYGNKWVNNKFLWY